MRPSLLIRLALAAAALATAAPAMADTFLFGFSPAGSQTLTLQFQGGGATVLNATNMGYYTSQGASETAFNNFENYIVGTGGGRTYNNFFTFDLTNVTGTITGATLSLYNPSATSDGGDGFGSGDGFNAIIYTLYDVSTSLTRLNGTQYTATDIYADLGSGTQYGITTASAANNGQQIQIALESAAVTALNSAEGHSFAIGGTAAGTNVAVASTPEPSSIALLGPAMAGLTWMRLRRRR